MSLYACPMREFLDERLLMDRCAGGDRDAYTTLYKSYLSGLLKYVFLFTRSQDVSEEIVQESFVKIWQNRESLREVQLFEPYLFKIAKNLLLDHLRKEKMQLKYHAQLALCSDESLEYADTALIYGQFYELAQHAITMLPQKRRQIFEMKTKEEFSLNEIADKLGISKSVVKKQLYAASNFVKDYLRKHGEMTVNGIIIMYYFLFI
jgi:RNA polymerase sigma-70 factor (ECF subfamily)